MQRGFRVISDDVCAINAQGQIVPGIPHIKLWQDAADGLDVKTGELTRIRPEMEKYRVPLGDAFWTDAVDVRTIYVLSPLSSEIVICEVLTGRDKFSALRSNTYRLPNVVGMGLAKQHFEQLTALSQRVRVKRVCRTVSGFHLDQLLDVLVVDASAEGAGL